MRTVSFNQFDGGQTNDPRDPRVDVCRVVKGFDNYTRAFKLTPHRSLKLDAVDGFESSLGGFRINKMLAANSTLYGIGTVSANDGHTQIYTKVTAGDPTAVWTNAINGTSSSSVELNIGGLVYHNSIYGVAASGVWKYGDITGSLSFTANDYTAHIPSAPGVVHSKYDIMYWPSGNLILQNDLHTGAGWSVGLTLPTNSNIVSICEDGNYLSIACNQPDGTAVVYRWDTQTTVNDLSEKIDWGNGLLKLIENIGGVLCGISTTSGTSNSIEGRVMFKYYSGTRVEIFQEFLTSSTFILGDKQRYNNLFYFLADMTIDGTIYRGLWKIYRNPSGRMAVSYDISPRNDTEITSGGLKGFTRWGDYIFISYLNPADLNYTIWRTNDQRVYTATSIYETTINPTEPERYRIGAGIRSNKKQMMGVALGTEPITSGQRAILKVRADGGAWKTVIDSSVVGTIVKENTFTTAATKIPNAREYEFRIESTGGAEITEVKYKVEVNETQL